MEIKCANCGEVIGPLVIGKDRPELQQENGRVLKTCKVCGCKNEFVRESSVPGGPAQFQLFGLLEDQT